MAGWQLLGTGYRVYLPGLMRFNRPDELSPFGRGGRNVYAYCGSDPVNHTDPSGHFIVPVLLGVVAAGATTGAVFTDDKALRVFFSSIAALAGLGAIATLGVKGGALLRAIGPRSQQHHRPSTRGPEAPPSYGSVMDQDLPSYTQAMKLKGPVPTPETPTVRVVPSPPVGAGGGPAPPAGRLFAPAARPSNGWGAVQARIRGNRVREVHDGRAGELLAPEPLPPVLRRRQPGEGRRG